MVKLKGCKLVAKYKAMKGDDWHKLRMQGIGGSDAGAVMGLSRYGSPLSVWMQKTGRVQPDEGNEYTEWGNILEPIIRGKIPEYLDRIGVSHGAVHDPQGLYQSKEHLWMLANVDGFAEITGELVGVEIKTTDTMNAKQWGGVTGDQLPDGYYAQVQHYMAVTGLSQWWVFALIGKRMTHRVVPRNDSFISALVDTERMLWASIVRNDPLQAPAPSGLDVDDEMLMVLGSPRLDDEVDITSIEASVMEYQAISREIRDLEAEKKALSQLIKAKMGQHIRGITGTHEVKVTDVSASRIDTDRLKLDRPDIVAEYTKTTEYQRLTVKEIA